MNGYTTQINYQPEMLAKINYLIEEVKRIRTELETLKIAAVFPPPPLPTPITRCESYACPTNQHGC
jgi:hypothetical protein